KGGCRSLYATYPRQDRGQSAFCDPVHTALADEGLLAFDHMWARWSWDLDRLYAKGYTENVVDPLVGKLHRLPVAKRMGDDGGRPRTSPMAPCSSSHCPRTPMLHRDALSGWEVAPGRPGCGSTTSPRGPALTTDRDRPRARDGALKRFGARIGQQQQDG